MVKGNFTEITGMSVSAKVHTNITQLQLQANDMMYCHYLTQASKTQDMLERMRLIVAYYIAAMWYNPSVTGCRTFVNAVLGETL